MRSLTLLLLCLCLTFSGACQHAPPTLSPFGTTAFQNLQIARSLDALRDIAIDGQATTPPVFTVNTARTIVTFHKSALQILNSRNSGWPAMLLSGLDAVVQQLSPAEREAIGPYISLIRAVVAEVTR